MYRPGVERPLRNSDKNTPITLTMLTFAVFDEHGLDVDWMLRHAHLIGADHVVAPGRVTFAGGLIRCEPQEAGSTALALQWDANDLGLLTLRTCLLPQRERPYPISLELARQQIMQFLVKIEEWSEFERGGNDPILTLFEQARAKFTEALIMEREQETGGSPAQDAVAREALLLALQASERLAIVHACASISAATIAAGKPSASSVNKTGDGAPSPESRPTIGVVVSPARFTEPLQRVLKGSVDFITVPLRWSELEPEEDAYDYSIHDRWIEWAVRSAKIPVVAGPLIDLRPGCVPDWLYIWENDYDTLREMVYEHVKRVVTRYRRVVSRWIVTSGLHVSGNFNLTLEQIIDLTRICAVMVRKLHPRASVRVEISQPFGEYAADANSAAGALAPQLYAEVVAQAGVGVDMFGIQLLMGDVAPGRSTRDLMAIADLLDRYAEFQRPLAVSLLGAPGAAPDLAATGYGEMDPGHWREPWSQAAQAQWLAHATVVALGHPAVTSVCWQALYDTGHEADMASGGLIDSTGQIRPAMNTLSEIRRRLHDGAPMNDLLSAELLSSASFT